jgi:16S rRNA (uracil1498-N3)-methyltransferase
MDVSALRTTSAHVLVDPGQLGADSITLDADAEHHLRRVLRLRQGESVGVSDGAGRWLVASVVIDGSTLRLEPRTAVAVEPSPAPELVIAAAMPKGDRLEWLVQKTTELGVDRLVLLHAERSVVRWKPDRAAAQRSRLQRISDEATRQSRRVRRLGIDGPFDAIDVLAGFTVAEPGGRRIAGGDTAIAVGPEGGWSPGELDAAMDRVSLGSTILRTETAAVAASTLCVTFNR